MNTPVLAACAASAMFVQDILATMMTQAEARNRASLAGLLDMLQDMAKIATMAVSIDVILLSHSMVRTVTVLTAVAIADYFGTFTGVLIGAKLIKDRKESNANKD